MSELDRITLELADVQDRLLKLPDDDFAERFRLQTRQDELRSAAGSLGARWDAARPTDEIEAELASQRARLEQLVNARSGYAIGMGGNNQGPGSAEMGRLAHKSKQAAGLDPISARIGHLEDVLRERSS